jgi:hypothetical protein
VETQSFENLGTKKFEKRLDSAVRILYLGVMTTYIDDVPLDETYDEAAEFWDDYDGADWYCNHDVPNGCRECAWAKYEEEMLDAMTPEERQRYFDGFSDVDEVF